MTPAPTPDASQRNRDLVALLARCALGDRAAFARLYELTSGQLFGVVLRINRDRAQAEEVLQEVLVKVWYSARTFDATQGQPLTWLTRIARNQAIDSVRRQQTQPRLQFLAADDADADDPYAAVESSAAGPLELLNQACEARDVSNCMQRLSAQQRQSVALAFYNGLSHTEVAEQLRQPLGTVKSWVRRGLQALKECLQDSAQAAAPQRKA